MEYKRRKYPHWDELSDTYLEDWCKKQIKWLKASVAACKGQEEQLRGLRRYINGTIRSLNEMNFEPYNIKCVQAVQERVPIQMDTKTVILCAAHCDRIAIAVMIVYLLWYDAHQRGTNTVTYEDAKRILWCNTDPNQWREAWEDQKFINDENGGLLDNMLDHAKIKVED